MAETYEPVSWEFALDLVASRLRATPPERSVFYTSGRTSNEAAFAYQLFVRGHGSNNLPDCSNMCHEPTSVALNEAIGIGKGTVQLEDFEQADLIVVIGQNPGTNHPRILSTLEVAKQSGAKIVSVNPLAEVGLMRFKNPQTVRGILGQGTSLSDLHLPMRLGQDGNLFRWLARRIVTRHSDVAMDRAFIEQSTSGFDTFRDSLLSLDEQQLAAAAGISVTDLEAFESLWVASKRIIICWAMGITQHVGAVTTIRDLTSLLLLNGNIGRPGAGLCPVRGHSNVQGDRTMGVWDKPTEEFLQALAHEFHFEPPTNDGLDVGGTVDALIRNDVDVLVCLGGNFVDAVPDTERVEQALSKLPLSVHISTKLNRSHLVAGQEAVIFPVLSRMEIDEQKGIKQFVTVEDSMSCVHASHGVLPPKSDLARSEVHVVCDLARRTLDGTTNAPSVDWAACSNDYRNLRAHIERVVPGFENFERRLEGEGFTLDNPARRREFKTPTQRAQFSVAHYADLTAPSDADLIVQTLRSHDQYNTTVYGHDDRYRGLKGNRNVLMISKQDLSRLGFREMEVVDIESVLGSERRWMRAVTLVAYPTPNGCAAAYYPEANILFPSGHRDPASGTPSSKSLPIKLHRRVD